MRHDGAIASPSQKKVRCAVYSRTSNDERLNQEFNSIDAQREACEAYIVSQRHEGWLLVNDRYEDGGCSGGTVERPALKRLLADAEAGIVNCIVVYKIDRLSRSLKDFMTLMDAFDRLGVSFVSITQSFSTSTAMGRCMLSIMVAFGQFEREQGAERVRDKIAASRAKGMWMGGGVPFGYAARNRRLEIKDPEAAIVRQVFARFIEIGSATSLARAFREEGVLTRKGRPFDKGCVLRTLANRVYLGEAVHKGTAYPGEHQAIIARDVWDKAQAIFSIHPRIRAHRTRAQTPALLKGLLFTGEGTAMSPTHTRRAGKLYRYYVSQKVLQTGAGSCPVGRISAGEIEDAVIGRVREIFRAPEIILKTAATVRQNNTEFPFETVRHDLITFDAMWGELFPDEQHRIVHLLLDRVVIDGDGLQLHLRDAAVANFAASLKRPRQSSHD